MNPLTNMRNVKKLSERELQSLPKSSWHDEYRSSAWIFVGGLPYNLSEGDVMAIFSQYGEITNLNLVRDKDTGKQKGFCFICYEDQRSTVLAVDNFNGTRVLGRILRVDHVKDYKPPKSSEPNAKVKIEKLDDDDFYVKKEFNADVKQEILSPEIKREICTPEIKREVCTPEIIRSPDYENDKKKKKSKDKRHSKDEIKDKDKKKYYKNEHYKSCEREKSDKRSDHNRSQEKYSSYKDSKSKEYKELSNRDNSREKDRKTFRDDRKEYKYNDYEGQNKRKHKKNHDQKDYENHKKYKK